MLIKSLIVLLVIKNINGAIVPPPWANPSSNPCAAEPRGWQLLYWPPDGKCYKIFKIGAPCPETMELGPSAKGQGVTAECRCPPGTAQSSYDSICYGIFTRAACPDGQYFAPLPDTNDSRRWGVCKKPEECERGKLFWPRDGKCYSKFTRGPCPRGQLLVESKEGISECSCAAEGELGAYYWRGTEEGCFEHYTRGPCAESGEIFMPGGICGCFKNMPHYHSETRMCYPLGGIGPCKQGHHYVVTNASIAREEEIYATCTCKPGHVLYSDGLCYRKYTRGPCQLGSMLINSTSCVQVPCKRGRLYFPRERTCYRVGNRGPCSAGQVVLYDHNVRPSVDGVSYNGVCGCTKLLKLSGKCHDALEENKCEMIPGMFLVGKTCHKLYTQGPCGQGEWLVAQRRPRGKFNGQWLNNNDYNNNKVTCECRPGYKRINSPVNTDTDVETNVLSGLPGECQPPAVGIANYLNQQYKIIQQ
ncbi:multiple epidermal growth factor-like domains protein 10 [Microplitis demolitor]|uniref:multiple epidermal growth factor-like domains protein 10 n=1 Tax=Microplitis demolitor TaxID=69319 RepID=UPI0004CD9266|nr:multiple epidermal growth factor-like domains protein 10 [Microplitis demolitor]